MSRRPLNTNSGSSSDEPRSTNRGLAFEDTPLNESSCTLCSVSDCSFIADKGVALGNASPDECSCDNCSPSANHGVVPGNIPNKGFNWMKDSRRNTTFSASRRFSLANARAPFEGDFCDDCSPKANQREALENTCAPLYECYCDMPSSSANREKAPANAPFHEARGCKCWPCSPKCICSDCKGPRLVNTSSFHEDHGCQCWPCSPNCVSSACQKRRPAKIPNRSNEQPPSYEEQTHDTNRLAQWLSVTPLAQLDLNTLPPVTLPNEAGRTGGASAGCACDHETLEAQVKHLKSSLSDARFKYVASRLLAGMLLVGIVTYVCCF